MAQKDRWKGEQALVVLQLRLKQFHLWPSVIKIKPLRRAPKAQPHVKGKKASPASLLWSGALRSFIVLFISGVSKAAGYWAFWMLELHKLA